MPPAQAKAHVREGYVNKSYSLEKRTADIVEKIADEYGIPKSCAVNIAVSRPAKFQKLLRASEDGEVAAIAAMDAPKRERDLVDQFFDWINEPDEDKLQTEEEKPEEKEKD